MDTSYKAPQGPLGEISYSSADLGIPAATALAGSATVTGTLIVSKGLRELAVNGKSTHAGTLTLTTYLDEAGTMVSEAVAGTLSANTPLTVFATAGKPFAAFKVSITDTSTSAGTCQALGALGQF